ncbi:MAG: protein-tyrosine-phosphatase [Planctomycetota bacterium]
MPATVRVSAAAAVAVATTFAGASSLHAGSDQPQPGRPAANGATAMPHATPPLSAELTAYLDAREAEFDRITEARKAELAQLGAHIAEALAADGSAKLTFICTHNSRRSHMSQLWAAAAATRVGLAGVETFSGGTEETAFNPRAVAALSRAGFDIRAEDGAMANPHYRVHMLAAGQAETPMTCFSKIYDKAPNPSEDFGAVMVCNSANEACPIVYGADFRLPITYVDPKAHDGTTKEAWAYDERCAQIARELLYAMRLAATPAATAGAETE